MSIDTIKSGLLTQIARQNIPSDNRNQMQTIYNSINTNSYSSNFNNLGGVSSRIQRNSNFIKCEDMLTQLAKFAGFDQFLGTIINDAFGDNLGLINAFKSLTDTVLAGMKSLVDGLDGIESAIGPVLAIVKTAMDLLSTAVDNPCLKAAAEMTYNYMPSVDKSMVNQITGISNPNLRNSYVTSYMKNTSAGKFL